MKYTVIKLKTRLLSLGEQDFQVHEWGIKKYQPSC